MQAVPEAAPAQNTSMPTLDPIFKCPKCNKYNMCLRTKRDNNGFFITCLGKPECTHVLWLADIIKEIKISENQCNKCRNGNKKLVIKFKTNNILAMLNASLINDNDRTYESCIICDNSLRVVLDINLLSPRADTSVNRNQTNNRPIPTQTTQRTNTNTNQRPQNNRPANPPTLPNPRPNTNQNTNPGGNQSSGNVKCTGCNQPAVK